MISLNHMNRLVATVISLYIAALLYLQIPFVKTLAFAGPSAPGLLVSHLIIFLAFFILLEFIIGRYVRTERNPGFLGTIKPFLLSFAFLGLVIAIFYHLIPVAPIYTFPRFLNPFFASDFALTLWLVAPLIILFL